jgi:hypothetical protein
MIDFPAAPTVGQTFSAAGVNWTWDGFKWTATGLNVAYLPMSGGTLTGPLYAPAGISAPQAMGDNRIINGDMRINQRNVTSGQTNGYMVDRWQYYSGSQAAKITWLQGTGPGAVAIGFPYYTGWSAQATPYTALAADTFSFSQVIEADMVSDFAWGMPNAQPATLSFWVSANNAGTYSGSLRMYPAPPTRSFVFSYNIPVSGTWTKITIPIPADTVGAWVMNGNAASIGLMFDLGSGSTYRAPVTGWQAGNFTGLAGTFNVVSVANAQLFITGVKLEIGTIATPFNHKSLAASMADCRRYFQNDIILWYQCYSAAAGNFGQALGFAPMRAAPSVTFNSITYGNASNIVIASGPNTVSMGVAATATAAGNSVYYGGATLNAEL